MLININLDSLNPLPEAVLSATDATEDPLQHNGLSTAEVADLLGVKRQTVYAYVSRGILHRQVALDGRTSVFDRAEVEELRLGRRPEREGEVRTMLSTRLTRVSDDGLWIRGHDLVQLVNDGAGFIQIADLLWGSPADEAWPLEVAKSPPGSGRGAVGDTLAGLALIDQLRVILAIESSSDPLRHDLSPKSTRAAGRRAIVAMGFGLSARLATTRTDTTTRTDSQSPLGDLLWGRLTAQGSSPARRRAVDVALALLADHGLAASTFAARIAASVRADPYSVIAAGLGALGGPLHGAASAQVYELYSAVEQRNGDAAAVVGEYQRRERVPGFGHAVYRAQDPRYGALMTKIVAAWADDPRLQTVFRVRDVIAERSDAMPNIDLALGALTYLARMPPDAGEAMFAIARTAGWLAHATEEYGEKPLRFRPTAQYLGQQPKSRRRSNQT